MDPIRVLLVDDHQLFRRGVASLLSGREDIEVVGEANNGAEAVERARELMPDVILMDIKMPRLDGIAATKQLKTEIPYVRIMMLTVSETDEDLFEAIKAGASGYLLKNVDPDYLIASVQQVQRGEVPIAPTMAAKILREQTGLDVRIEAADAIQLAPAVEAQVIRIVQEALTNVRKHADARGVVVRFGREGDAVLVAIRDDGRGFDLAAVEAAKGMHFGLLTMRERAESIGGALRVRSAPGQGTAGERRLPGGDRNGRPGHGADPRPAG